MTPVTPASNRLAQFLAHWEALRGSAAMPGRRDFDIVQVPTALVPHLILLDVLDGGGGLRYRVVGTGVVDAIGRDFTGETVEQYHTRHESLEVRDGYVAVARTARPHLYCATLTNIGKDHVAYERLALPLGGDDGAVARIIACFEFGPAQRPDDPQDAADAGQAAPAPVRVAGS